MTTHDVVIYMKPGQHGVDRSVFPFWIANHIFLQNM